MSSSMILLGIDKDSERSLFLLEVESLSEVPVAIMMGSKYFVSLIACDARRISTDEISALARALLASGCIYFCCWGPDCERVHDIIDETYLEMTGLSIQDDESTIMTSWHDEQTLQDAAWYTLHAAFPDDRFFDECKAVVATCVGNSAWADQIRAAFTNNGGISPGS